MRKVVFLLAVALLLAGTAWGQASFTQPDSTGLDGSSAPAVAPTVPGWTGAITENMFGLFDVMDASSVESRYSNGIFSSMVDDYIGVNSFDPEVGTFFFMGGFPGKDGTAASNPVFNNSVLNLGLAKTFGFGYLGIYYRGNIVNGDGWKVTKFKDDTIANDINDVYAYGHDKWANRIAVIFGTDKIGAVRMDFMTNSDVYDAKATGNNNTGAGTDKDKVYDGLKITTGGNTKLAFTWGGKELKGLSPYATIGYVFPNSVSIKEDAEYGTTVKTNTYKETSGAGLGFQLGASHGDSGIFGDIFFGLAFGKTIASFYNTSETTTLEEKSTEGTDAMFGLKVGISKGFEAEKISFGFQPRLLMGIYGDNQDTVKDTQATNGGSLNGESSTKGPNVTHFNLKGEIDLGLKFQLNPKFALYTGIGLNIFNWQTAAQKGEKVTKSTGGVAEVKTQVEASAWKFDGISWNDGTNLSFGLTFTPAENLVIGAGFNSFTDKIFKLTPSTMQLETGTWFNQAGTASSEIGAIAKLFDGLKFDLTVSYQVPNSK